MSQLYRIKFHFTAPVHIGSVRADYDSSQKRLHSDTLYSAIMQAWSVLDRVDLIEKNPAFTVSSLFPFQQMGEDTNETLYFFPKPVNALQPTEYRTHKKLKKIQYLEQTVFKKYLKEGENAFMDWLKGETEDFKSKETTEKYINGSYCFDDSENFNSNFLSSKVYPRVYVPRQGERNNGELLTDTEIYYIERLFFNGNSGLFCLAQFDSEQHKNNVIGALNYLGDEGIGTDRNVGNGSFEVTCEVFNDFNDLTSINSDYRLNLSLFCPDNQDDLASMLPESDEHIAYHLQKRGGWITKAPYLTYRKQSVYMFGEGSVFKTSTLKSNVETMGKTVDLQPKNTPNDITHPIYRVGKSLFLPIHT